MDLNNETGRIIFECRCGTTNHRPANMGNPPGWTMIKNVEGKALICADCSLIEGIFLSARNAAPANPAPATDIGLATPAALKDGDVPNGFRLRTGGLINLADPDYEKIHIRDIASGLARECRFGGQISGYYSVAEHCVIASLIAPQAIQYAVLMHDAAEAIIKDIPSPLKSALSDYRKLESLHETRMFERFMVSMALKKQVKRIDLIMLSAENVAVRNQIRFDAFVGMNKADMALANQAIKLIDAGRGKSYERPFIERFYRLAPIEILEAESKVA